MTEEKLVRGIGRWDLTAIVINSIIGAGIFGLPSKIAALIGSYSIFAFLLCALIIGVIVLCFAEVASRFSTTGGMYLYAREAFGPLVGFEIGWLAWVVRVATFAANCNLLLSYAGFFFPSATEGIVRITLIIVIVTALTAINFVGVRESTLLTNIFTVGKLLPLLLFAALGLFFIQPANFQFDALPGYSSFSAAVLLALYAFVGFENAVVPAGETEDPKKNVPLALFMAIGVVFALYILIQTVSIGTLPGIASSERPLADASVVFLGGFGATLITLGAIVSILGNLNSGFLTGSRMPFAMAEHKELPVIISRTHPRFRTPHVSILITGAVILILTVQSSFLTALTISTITRLFVYAATCLALPVFRRRKDLPEAKFRAPTGVLASVLSLILIVWLLTTVDYQKEGLAVIITGLVGLVIYFAYLYARKDDRDVSKEDEATSI
jgi:basic amino acid/polyamine antiporter, APA family